MFSTDFHVKVQDRKNRTDCRVLLSINLKAYLILVTNLRRQFSTQKLSYRNSLTIAMLLLDELQFQSRI
jgi:hypothetical protein